MEYEELEPRTQKIVDDVVQDIFEHVGDEIADHAKPPVGIPGITTENADAYELCVLDRLEEILPRALRLHRIIAMLEDGRSIESVAELFGCTVAELYERFASLEKIVEALDTGRPTVIAGDGLTVSIPT